MSKKLTATDKMRNRLVRACGTLREIEEDSDTLLQAEALLKTKMSLKDLTNVLSSVQETIAEYRHMDRL